MADVTGGTGPGATGPPGGWDLAIPPLHGGGRCRHPAPVPPTLF
jgi:hypothetical protein